MSVTYYAINLDIRRRPCLVVGGGNVGTRKVATLLESGAQVTVVSPDMSEGLQKLAGHPNLTLIRRAYRTEDLAGIYLVIGASSNAQLNRRIGREAGQRQILCNIVDQPDICSFVLPAVVRRGDLTLTVSTAGKSPALAKKLRRQLETQFGEEYAVMLRLMGNLRKRLLEDAHAPEAHKHIFESLLENGLLDMIREGRRDAIDRLLQQVLGQDYSYAQLMTG
jgi:precorrin-2 dehydrogenase/sirohydrochlorin ferrochelatase